MRLKVQIGVDGRRFMEIGAFANPTADADQSTTPIFFSEGSQVGISQCISKSYFRDGLTSNVYCGVAKY
jgi:hypothetical protein